MHCNRTTRNKLAEIEDKGCPVAYTLLPILVSD